MFDRNGALTGTDISHVQNSSEIHVSQAGWYFVSFQSSVTPGPGETFPLSVRLFLTSQGQGVAGASAVHTFTAQGTTAVLSFSQILQVDLAPVTLQVEGQGGSFLYGETNVSVIRIR